MTKPRNEIAWSGDTLETWEMISDWAEGLGLRAHRENVSWSSTYVSIWHPDLDQYAAVMRLSDHPPGHRRFGVDAFVHPENYSFDQGAGIVVATLMERIVDDDDEVLLEEDSADLYDQDAALDDLEELAELYPDPRASTRYADDY